MDAQKFLQILPYTNIVKKVFRKGAKQCFIRMMIVTADDSDYYYYN